MKLNWTVILTTLFLSFSICNRSIAQQKLLSIQLNAPTQMYPGETIKLKVQVMHQIKTEKTGHINFAIFKAGTNQSVDGWFLNFFPFQYFTTIRNENFETEFPFTVPNDYIGKFDLELVAQVDSIKDSVRFTIPTLIKR